LGTTFDGAMFLALVAFRMSSVSFDPIYQDAIDLGVTFHAHFTRFLIHNYATYNDNSYPPYKKFVEMDSIRKVIQQTDWYPRFYKDFVDNSSYNTSIAQTFEKFVDGLNSDIPLKTQVNSTLTNFTNFDRIIDDYHTYYEGVQYANVGTSWEYKDTGDWKTCFEGRGQDWSDYFNIWDNPPLTTQYRITVIDNDLSVVEYDSMTVYVDTAMNALFAGYQVDSTVYFYNLTEGTTSRTTYIWSFGDGDSSELVNPQHTFPAYDSAYVVCLTASNVCGNFTYCDTVLVDSAGELQGLHKRGNTVAESVKKLIEKQSEQSVITNSRGDKHHLSFNRPNPFSSTTLIEYRLKDGITQGSIRVTNPMGQEVNTFKLHRQTGAIVVDGTSLKDGLYYYSLIVEGAVVASKVMIVSK
jgi:hypothetical protein